MKLSIFIVCFLSIQTLHQDGSVVLVSGFQVFPATTRQPGWLQSPERSITQSIVPSTTMTRTATTSNSHSPTALYIFGGLFGGGSSSKMVLREEEPVTMYTSTTTTTTDDDDQHYEALGEYIEKWSKLLTNGNIKLTTPVTVELVHPLPTEETKASHNRCRGVRLLFKDTNTGYKTKSEEKESNNSSQSHTASSDEDNSKKEKKGASKVKQGGVEILVEKNNNGIQVTAKRCEIEEDTIIKEMSEETILNELKQALEVWKRETQS